MNPLNSSSLNAERARVEAARSSAPADAANSTDGAAGGGFADLLRGAQGGGGSAQGKAVMQSPGAASQRLAALQAKPLVSGAGVSPSPLPAAAGEAQARQQAAKSTTSTTSSSDETRAAESDDTAAQESEDTPATQGDTLAHWLLNQGAYVADPAQMGQARADGLPPPQNAAGASDDLKAAAMAREVLDAVRSRAKAATTGQHRLAGAGPEAAQDAQTRSAADGSDRQAGRMSDPMSGLVGSQEAAAAVAPQATSAEALRHQDRDAAFSDKLDAALQAPPPVLSAPPTLAGASAPAPVAAAERAIDTPVQHPAFGEAVGVSISQLARDGVQEARLQLNPAELGPVSVRIAMQGQEARIELGAAHAHTRALLDASLPALTEAFRADGLVLAASQVSEWQDPRSAGDTLLGGQGRGSQPGQGGSDAGSAGGREPRPAPSRIGWVGRADTDLPLPAPSAWQGRGLGGLDLYA